MFKVLKVRRREELDPNGRAHQLLGALGPLILIDGEDVMIGWVPTFQLSPGFTAENRLPWPIGYTAIISLDDCDLQLGSRTTWLLTGTSTPKSCILYQGHECWLYCGFSIQWLHIRLSSTIACTKLQWPGFAVSVSFTGTQELHVRWLWWTQDSAKSLLNVVPLQKRKGLLQTMFMIHRIIRHLFAFPPLQSINRSVDSCACGGEGSLFPKIQSCLVRLTFQQLTVLATLSCWCCRWLIAAAWRRCLWPQGAFCIWKWNPSRLPVDSFCLARRSTGWCILYTREPKWQLSSHSKVFSVPNICMSQSAG